jgi:hypothetical protein
MVSIYIVDEVCNIADTGFFGKPFLPHLELQRFLPEQALFERAPAFRSTVTIQPLLGLLPEFD